MINLALLRENPQAFTAAAKEKGFKVDIEKFLELDKAFREKKNKFEELRALQNKFNKELPKIKDPAEKEQKLSQMKKLAQQVKALEEEVQVLKRSHLEEWLKIPALPSPDTPKGESEEENVEVFKKGEIPSFSFKAKDHLEIGKELSLIDIERGVKISGTRHYFLKGKGVALHRAVLQLSLDFLTEKGYTLLEPPHIVGREAMEGTGYFPWGREQAYKLDEEREFYLIGTSEVPLCAYYKDEILQEEELPIKFAACTPCYRREAGSYGKDVRGLYRLHQFYKVEQVIICRDDLEESNTYHQELLDNACRIVEALELPYRVVQCCTGELGLGQYKKHDVECWMPSRNSYSETHSCSTMLDFQARRLKLRYRTKNKEKRLCFTLNSTSIASPRILIPLLEVHQKEDGSVYLPKAIRKYLGEADKIAKN
ncbi:MAG: serine--tRNA ligase [Candidatus Dadabacteria bacterium]|nr:MAG: serine--tRNA ligase [Candidatus Dadabacteria bacterium]